MTVQRSLPGMRGPGRPRKKDHEHRFTMVPHRPRPDLAARHPVHVTLKLRRRTRTLRTGRLGALLRQCLTRGRDRLGMRIVHYSIQHDHIHLIVEAEGRKALSLAMQGFGIRIARAINRALGLKGRALKERYHMRILETPTEVRNVLRYVLNNYQKHGGPLARGGDWDGVDPFTSGRYFDGWRKRPRIRVPLPSEPPVAPARTWLLSKGWRLLGPIALGERPG